MSSQGHMNRNLHPKNSRDVQLFGNYTTAGGQLPLLDYDI